MQALYQIGDFVETTQPPPVIATPMPLVWYLLRLHPNYDLKAERQLHERGISAYVPKEKRTIKGAWNRRTSRTVPIFPGAMFIPDFDADIAKLKTAADGVGGFVKYCGEAVRVSLRTMAEVRRFEAKRNGIPEGRKFKVDQRVRIVAGPFELMEGKIDRVESRFRFSVLIEFLGASTRLTIDEGEIEAIL
jgi:transcription antitermination factor NusG